MSYDLTPNRIFSRPMKGFNMDILLRKDAKIPWAGIENIPYERSKYRNDDSLFRIGTVEDIRFKKEMAAMEQGSICECCGQETHKFPWSKNTSCLCDRCLAQLEEDCGTDMWGNKKKSENPELTHPWWFYL